MARLTIWAVRRAASYGFPITAAGSSSTVHRAASIYLDYLQAIQPGCGSREPRLAAPGTARLTRDERRLLRAVAAACAGDEQLLDNNLYQFALDRSARLLLAGAVRAWAAALTRQQPERNNMRNPHAPAATRLSVTETALLWAIRSWVRGRQQRRSAEDEIARIFASLGASHASTALFGLMWVLDNAAYRKLAVNCPCHAGLSADERSLLDVLALTQERDGLGRLLLLRTIIRPIATVPAGQSATMLVQGLNRAGLFLETCHSPVRLCAFPTSA